MSKMISVSIPEGSGDALAAAADFFTQLATIAYGAADEVSQEAEELLDSAFPVPSVPSVPSVPQVPLTPPVAEAPRPPATTVGDHPSLEVSPGHQPELDSAGYPWDERIHGATKKKTKKIVIDWINSKAYF